MNTEKIKEIKEIYNIDDDNDIIIDNDLINKLSDMAKYTYIYRVYYNYQNNLVAVTGDNTSWTTMERVI